MRHFSLEESGGFNTTRPSTFSSPPTLSPPQPLTSSSSNVAAYSPFTFAQSLLSSMPTTPQTFNPAANIYPSTPSPEHIVSTADQVQLAQGVYLDPTWPTSDFFASDLSNVLPQQTKEEKVYRRISHVSPIESVGSPSTHDQDFFAGLDTKSDSPPISAFQNLHFVSTSPTPYRWTKPLPTPVGTPTSQHHMPPGHQRNDKTPSQHESSPPRNQRTYFSPLGGDGKSQPLATSRPSATMNHTSLDTEYGHRGAQGEPVQNDMVTMPFNGYLQYDPAQPQSDAFHESVQAVFADRMYQASTLPDVSQGATSAGAGLVPQISPKKDLRMVANHLQSPNQERVAHGPCASTTMAARVPSPFKAYQPMENFNPEASSGSPMATIPQTIMEQAIATGATKSVSPKELMLDDADLADHAGTPLFPTGYNAPNDTLLRRTRDHAPMSYGGQDRMLGAPSYSEIAASQTPGHYQYQGNQRRTRNYVPSGSGPEPEFPAHLVSMETTVGEEAGEPSSSQQSADTSGGERAIPRPDDTSSDLGNYTCTYHGCTQRLESPVKLQKHKREAHRHPSPGGGSPPAAAGPSSGLSRNSQAGPHRCERVNPSTGKPCHSIFSRPYDLTRHEDTIHSARKHKARCDLCSEEKTFSRNDALTRHMRVVHPDVNWSGKVRKSKSGH